MKIDKKVALRRNECPREVHVNGVPKIYDLPEREKRMFYSQLLLFINDHCKAKQRNSGER